MKWWGSVSIHYVFCGIFSQVKLFHIFNVGLETTVFTLLWSVSSSYSRSQFWFRFITLHLKLFQSLVRFTIFLLFYPEAKKEETLTFCRFWIGGRGACWWLGTWNTDSFWNKRRKGEREKKSLIRPKKCYKALNEEVVSSVRQIIQQFDWKVSDWYKKI